jgi:magnesium transporter
VDIAGTCRGCGHGSRRKNFEETFSQRIELALFLPVIVYMSDSIGTETLALFVREMSQRKVELHRFFLREARVGLALGLLSAVPMGALRVSLVWRGPSGDNTRDRVLTGMLAPLIFARLGKDPLSAPTRSRRPFPTT